MRGAYIYTYIYMKWRKTQLGHNLTLQAPEAAKHKREAGVARIWGDGRAQELREETKAKETETATSPDWKGRDVGPPPFCPFVSYAMPAWERRGQGLILMQPGAVGHGQGIQGWARPPFPSPPVGRASWAPTLSWERLPSMGVLGSGRLANTTSTYSSCSRSREAFRPGRTGRDVRAVA